MKRTIYLTIFSLLFLLLTHCRTTRDRQVQEEKKSLYIEQFKLTYFRKLLQSGFNNSGEIRSILNLDRSGFTEQLLTKDDYHLLDSIVRMDVMKLKADSGNRIGRVAEGAEGIHLFSYILDKLESKWLDSLAKRGYKTSGLEGEVW